MAKKRKTLPKEIKTLLEQGDIEGAKALFLKCEPNAIVGGKYGSNIFSLTPLLAADGFGFVLAAGCAGWGGLSVLCQTAAVLEGSGLRLRNCLLGKVLQGLLSAVLALALQKYVLG